MELTLVYLIKGNKVKPVDMTHTGEVKENTYYFGGLHQFLEAKNALPISDERLYTSQISHVSFFNKYGSIFGLSGTLGETSERNELDSYYELDTFDVPVQVQGSREVWSEVIEETTSGWMESIKKEAIEQAQRGRSVLVIVLKISDTLDIQKLIATSTTTNKVTCQLLNAVQSESEDEVVAKAGKPGMITLATNIGGRGMDIRTVPQTEQAGGMHVIVGFHPLNTRIEVQAFGRTARQGKKGSVRMILCREKLRIDGNIPTMPAQEILTALNAKRRIETIVLSLVRTFVVAPTSKVLDSLVLEFAEKVLGPYRYGSSKDDLDKKMMAQGIKDHWMIWLTYVRSEIVDKLESGEKGKLLIESYDLETGKGRISEEGQALVQQQLDFLKQSYYNTMLRELVPKIQSRELVNNNPTCLMIRVESYREAKTPEKAINDLQRILALDPTHTTALWCLGSITKQESYLHQALSIADINLKLNPWSGQVLSDKAQALKLLNRRNESIECLRTALRYWPENSLILTNLAAAELSILALDDAVKHAEEALKYSPTYWVAKTNVGVTNYQKGKQLYDKKDYRNAKRYLERALPFLSLMNQIADAKVKLAFCKTVA